MDTDKASPIRPKELAAILAAAVVADVLLYRLHGFAAFAGFLLVAPVILWSGSPNQERRRTRWPFLAAIGILAVRLIWCGNWLAVLSGIGCLLFFAMATAGLSAQVLEGAVFSAQAAFGAPSAFWEYRRWLEGRSMRFPGGAWLSVGLPVVALLIFGSIFIVANPDLLDAFGESLEYALTHVREWILSISPSPLQLLIWLAAVWLTAGLLRPLAIRGVIPDIVQAESVDFADTGHLAYAKMYPPFRNTLATVIALFGVYLVFEFKTLWFRTFPPGFHYSGYAHEGAAWLTVALALATALLSIVFRGRILADHRLPKLRRLAWIWSVQNLILALAVYNRLTIYVGFNGMTRMRMVAFFGITCVVAGFLLVVVKIAREKDFPWLLRRHLWVVVTAAALYSIVPVDWIAHTYNTNRILSGDPAPSVQLTVHPIDSEGLLAIRPLVNCDNPTIRDGVCALLAQRLSQEPSENGSSRKKPWTDYQMADEILLHHLEDLQPQLGPFQDPARRDHALDAFREYAYKWY